MSLRRGLGPQPPALVGIPAVIAHQVFPPLRECVGSPRPENPAAQRPENCASARPANPHWPLPGTARAGCARSRLRCWPRGRWHKSVNCRRRLTNTISGWRPPELLPAIDADFTLRRRCVRRGHRKPPQPIPPGVAITSPPNHAIFSPGSGITISAMARDPDGNPSNEVENLQ